MVPWLATSRILLKTKYQTCRISFKVAVTGAVTKVRKISTIAWVQPARPATPTYLRAIKLKWATSHKNRRMVAINHWVATSQQRVTRISKAKYQNRGAKMGFNRWILVTVPPHRALLISSQIRPNTVQAKTIFRLHSRILWAISTQWHHPDSNLLTRRDWHTSK